MSLKISQKFLVAVMVPVVFELALVGTLFYLLGQADAARLREQQARELGNRAYALMGLHVARISQMLIYKSTEDPAMLSEAMQTSARMRAEIEQIHNLVRNNPQNNETWKSLDRLVRQIGDEHDSAGQKLKEGDKAGAGLLYISMKRHFDDLLRTTDTLTAQQAASKDANGVAVSSYSEMIRLVLGISVIISLLISFGLALFFRESTSKRLQVIIANTEKMAAGKAPGQRLHGKDELARIDRLYHKMHQSLTIMRRRERAILENVADIVCCIDSSMRFSDINAAAHTHWGYDAIDLIGGRVADIILDTDREAVLEALRNVIATAQTARIECAVRRNDASAADTEWSATWSEEENSLYCVIHDISDRKNLDRMKAEFVAMVSHEIRTPLCSIQMTHSLLAEELGASLDEFMSKNLTDAQDNINRLMALVNNLLVLDKLESGFIDFIAEPITLGEVVETSIGAISALLRQKSIEVTRNIDPNMMIYADKERLVQVMINLVSNAYKYSPPNSKITIKAKLVKYMSLPFVRVEVSDKGRGIPESKLNTIFERFRQVEAADEKVHKGSGLGLAIAKAIVERHHGKMAVESVEGEGSTFWFTVPASQISYEHSAQVSQSS